VKAQPGDVFDKWTVLREGPRSQTGGVRRVWCRCSCGREKLVFVLVLGSGKSSGCQHCASTKHGVTRKGSVPAEYRSWQAMVKRCTNPKCDDYKNYGARGITVCARWMDVRSFIADMGPRPSPRHSIDRINNDGNYEPGNCRWATRREQCQNTRANRVVEAFGVSRCVAEWADETGLAAGLISGRLARGWPPELALTSAPSFKRKRVQTYYTERAR
jgi:hypothetical protein